MDTMIDAGARPGGEIVRSSYGRSPLVRPGAHERRGRHERRDWSRDVTPAARTAAVEDARLLVMLRRLGWWQRSLYPRLLYVAMGFAAISSLAVAYAEVVPLPVGATLVVVPAVTCVVVLSVRHPRWGRRALVGWLAGIVATIIYDLLRLSLVKVGLWGDPIPAIGRLALADPDANFVWGYVWRFLGNGGGMGLAFAMLPWRGVRIGIAYGTMICLGLFGLLIVAPRAQLHFFPLTPVTAAGAMAGHWVYGAVLGWLTWWWLPPVELRLVRGRLVARLRHAGPTAPPKPKRTAAPQRTAARAPRATRAGARVPPHATGPGSPSGDAPFGAAAVRRS